MKGRLRGNFYHTRTVLRNEAEPAPTNSTDPQPSLAVLTSPLPQCRVQRLNRARLCVPHGLDLLPEVAEQSLYLAMVERELRRHLPLDLLHPLPNASQAVLR